MKLVSALALLGAWLVLPAVAQQTEPDEPRGERRQMRQMRRPDGRFGGRGGPMFGGFTQRIPEELGLDDEQRAQFEDIVAEFRERMTEARRGGEGMRELFEQMREAREAGDEERMQELRAQFRERRGAGGQLMDQFFDDVEGILREDQVPKLQELRSRFAERMRGRGDPMAQLRDLRERLKLDEEQQTQFDDLLAELREQGGQRRQRMQDMRPLMRELREAQEAGDEARVEELRAQLEELRPQRGAWLDDFLTKLESILKEDQKAILAEFRQERGQRGERRGELDVRAIMAAAQRLDLDRDQRAELRGIMQEAMRAERELGRRDREGRAVLAAQTKKEVLAILDAEQGEQFERLLSQQGRRGRPERMGAGERVRERRRARTPGEERP
jgi:Spy/CpxP family protein refolding chaperone